MTEKCVALEENVDPNATGEASTNDGETSESTDTTDRKTTNLHDNLAVNYKGQSVPMILVEQASLVSAFPYTTEDPVYTPPTEHSVTPPGGPMDEYGPSLLEHQKSSAALKEKTKCPKKKKGPWYLPSVTCIPIIVIVILIGMVVMVPIILDQQQYLQRRREGPSNCTDLCIATLVESIPMNLTYPPGSPSHPSIHANLMKLLARAKKSVKIASSYWTLRGVDVSDQGTNTSWAGEYLFEEIRKAGLERNIKVQIAQDKPKQGQAQEDTKLLAEEKAAEVRSLDFECLLKAGILHTKMWIVDDEHFYLGSANMDWRSFTQVKELGIIVTNCSCMAKDLAKIFDVYWIMGGVVNGTLPKHWPERDHTRINSSTPLEVAFNGSQRSQTYFSSSPPQLSPEGREEDADAIIGVIRAAKLFVHVAVMDFAPAFLYKRHEFWPNITNELIHAAIDRRVKVRVLMSNWTHTRKDIVTFLKSLQAIDGAFGADVKVKLFTVPAFDEKQAKIPYARVNHNKYMVTDNRAYIGTNNWSGDYFEHTGGIGLVINQTLSEEDSGIGIRSQLADVFTRDWESAYAHPLPQ